MNRKRKSYGWCSAIKCTNNRGKKSAFVFFPISKTAIKVSITLNSIIGAVLVPLVTML